MIWYIPDEFSHEVELKKESKLLIFDEAPDVVLETLLIRPNDRNAQWKANADALDMTRVGALTYVGHITNVLIPAKTSMGLWGLTLSAWREGVTTGTSADDFDKAFAHLSMQVNGQVGVAEQLGHKNRGTLLWVSEIPDASDGALRYAWAIAPAAYLMSGTNDAKYDGTQPAFINFRLNDPLYGSVPQPLSISPRNYGFVVGQSTTTLSDALKSVVSQYPVTG